MLLYLYTKYKNSVWFIYSLECIYLCLGKDLKNIVTFFVNIFTDKIEIS